MTTATSWRSDGRDWLAVLLALTLPSLATGVYFVWLEDAEPFWQRGAYVVLKTLQFAFPAFWVLAIQRQRPRWVRPDGWGLAAGIAFGLAVLAAGLGLYYAWLKPTGYLDAAVRPICDKVHEFGVRGLWGFVVLAAFYSLVHSLLEEYYFRWFLFGQLRRLASLPVAISVSSLGFMAHHVIVLGTYLGWLSPGTVLFSLAVAIGGAVWAWMYHRSGSLWGPWVSHLIVDVAIFAVGYDLVGHLLRG